MHSICRLPQNIVGASLLAKASGQSKNTLNDAPLHLSRANPEDLPIRVLYTQSRYAMPSSGLILTVTPLAGMFAGSSTSFSASSTDGLSGMFVVLCMVRPHTALGRAPCSRVEARLKGKRSSLGIQLGPATGQKCPASGGRCSVIRHLAPQPLLYGAAVPAAIGMSPGHDAAVSGERSKSMSVVV